MLQTAPVLCTCCLQATQLQLTCCGPCSKVERFLSEEYSAAATCLQGWAVWGQLQPWFASALGVLPLLDAGAAGFILSAHRKPGVINTCSRQQVIQQGQFVVSTLQQVESDAGMRQEADAL